MHNRMLYERIATEMKRQGLTWARLTREGVISKEVVARMRCGLIPKPHTLQRIAERLGMHFAIYVTPFGVSYICDTEDIREKEK